MTSYYFAAFEPSKMGYVVRIPDLPEIATQGDDLAEAMEMAMDAARETLDAYREEGRAIPEPSSLERVRELVEREDRELGWETPEGTIWQMVPVPEMDKTPVKVTMSFPRYVLRELDRKAKLAGLTRSGYVASLAMR